MRCFPPLWGSCGALKISVSPRFSGSLAPEQFAYLHIPKTGTSIANTFLTWACPGIPDDDMGITSPIVYIPAWFDVHKGWCKKGFNIVGGHLPFGVGWNHLKGHQGGFTAMFRQPEQRVASGFHHDRHDYWDKNSTMADYARHVRGCAVRMMTGYTCGCFEVSNESSCPKGNANVNAVNAAVKNLKTQFAFVGLTDQFDLSICLFHKQFGGNCHTREFKQLRPGNHAQPQYNTSMLNGFVDSADGELYDEAKRIFWDEVARFDVHRRSCLKTCASFPQPFVSTNTSSSTLSAHTNMREYDWEGRWAYHDD